AKKAPSKPPVEDEEEQREVPPTPPETEDEEEAPPPKKPAKKSALPMILMGCGAAALLGIVLLCVGVPLAFYMMIPADVTKIATGIATGPAGAQNPVVLGPNWVPYEDAEFSFKAEFPNVEPAPFDPLAEITDPTKRDLVAGFMKTVKGKYLSATD